MLTTEMLECPQCGGPVRMDERECSYCHSPILVKRVQDLDKKRPMEINKYIKAYQNFLKNHEAKVQKFLQLWAFVISRMACMTKRYMLWKRQ